MTRTARTRAALVALTGGLLLTTFASSASSTTMVARGELQEFAAGTGRLDVTGHAELFRRANDTTFVVLHAEGLTPGGAYASHVHAKACDDGAAGGHYMHDRGGEVDAVNEIWPGGSGFTATDGGTATVRATNGFTAGPDAVSVVIHELRADGTKPKVACADLR